MKNKKAFTLMEVLIVIIILGAITSFALPQFNRSIERSRRQDAEAQLSTLHGAISLNRAQTGTLYGTNGIPVNVATLNADLELSLIESGMTFEYTRNTATTYTATAERTDNSFTLTMTQANIVPGANPSCAGPANICN